MKFISYQFLFAMLLLSPAWAGAETVHLKDGSIITGKIKNIGAEGVFISTVIGDITIESAKISRVEGKGRTPQSAEQQEQATRAAEPAIKSYADSHMRQKNGLGFGPGIGEMLGISTFYDRNLSGNSQVHIQLNANRGVGLLIDWLLGSDVRTDRYMLLTTYRYFPAENKGFYLGGGGGYADATLEYNSSGSTPYKYTSRLSGVFVLGEVGWQGKDGYYFTVGFQPAAFVSSSDNYDVNQIPTSRASANDEHDRLKALSQISVGFGGFF